MRLTSKPDNVARWSSRYRKHQLCDLRSRDGKTCPYVSCLTPRNRFADYVAICVRFLAATRSLSERRNNVPKFRRLPAGLVASGAIALGLFYSAGVTSAGPVPNEVMLDNTQTGKCLTIAGGVSMDNNIPAVQFNCDSDPSRRWRLAEMGGNGIYQIRNVQTGKCLTIAGGRSTDNNVQALQFNCDSDPSRTWRIDDVTGSGLHQIRNVQTNKCLTVAGGRSTDNNVEALQFNCDSDPSRTWTIRLKL
jgi:cytolethal distending toxin subunit A